MKRLPRVFLIFSAVAAAAVLGAIADVQFRYISRIITLQDAPQAEIALVLGASVQADGQPSDALRDRLLVGLALYRSRQAAKIMITGDDGAYHVDEISSMKRFLLANRVPDSDILVDGQGYRTYESCKRAAQAFKIKNAVIVTQRFHIGRALYLCNRLGLESRGVASDLQTYKRSLFFWLRDLAASAAAWWDVNVLPPRPPR